MSITRRVTKDDHPIFATAKTNSREAVFPCYCQPITLRYLAKENKFEELIYSTGAY